MEKEFNILIADDEDVVRKFLMRVLRKNNCKITLARDGEEAIKKIEEDNYNLVFLDIRMPKLNGVEVFKFIKKTKPDLPVVIMSSSSQWDLEKEAKMMQPYKFLDKPLEVKDILETIEGIRKSL